MLHPSLPQHGMGLRADPFDHVHYDDGTVREPDSSRHLGGEVNVAGRVNDVNEVGRAVCKANRTT